MALVEVTCGIRFMCACGWTSAVLPESGTSEINLENSHVRVHLFMCQSSGRYKWTTAVTVVDPQV